MQTMPNSQYPASQPLTAAAKPPQPVDSDASLRPESEMNPAWPAVFYPTATPGEMFRCLNSRTPRLFADLTGYLVMLPEPDLYLLAAAVFWLHQHPEAGESWDISCFGGEPEIQDARAPVGIWSPRLAAALLTELGWRNCREMGSNPTGAARRGRLLQFISTFAPLSRSGPSPTHRGKMLGNCPFCAARAELCVLLPEVRWRCFSCELGGGLLEFGQEILYAAMGHPTTGTVSS